MAIITKYDIYLSEKLSLSVPIENTIRYLTNVKKDKVALYLTNLSGTDYYNNDEIINYIGNGDQDNMISYLPTNRRPKNLNWEEIFSNPQRVSLRIGRAIRKIYDATKSCLNYKGNTKIRFYRDRYQNLRYIMDTQPGEKNPTYENVMVIYSDETSNDVYPKIKIKGNDFLIEGICTDITNYWGFNQFGINVSEETNKVIFNKFRAISGMHDYGRVDDEYEIDVEIEIESDFEITDSDIEKFTNEFISFSRMNKSDESSIIIEVKGEDIRYWYDRNNYSSGGESIGKLGNSCMSHEETQEYLSIYVDNSEVISMLILLNKEKKLVGRALLWKLNNGEFFMDRIYTANDSDDNIFINYAIEKNYTYRRFSTNGVIITYLKNSKELPDFEAETTLKYSDYETYPYSDTLRYLYKDGLISNKKVTTRGRKTLNDTEGKWEEYYNGENDDDE